VPLRASADSEPQPLTRIANSQPQYRSPQRCVDQNQFRYQERKKTKPRSTLPTGALVQNLEGSASACQQFRKASTHEQQHRCDRTVGRRAHVDPAHEIAAPLERRVFAAHEERFSCCMRRGVWVVVFHEGAHSSPAICCVNDSLNKFV
jgi:hypothetical protein